MSIPTWYKSYMSPISSETLFNAVRKTQRRDRPGAFSAQMPYVVRLHNKFVAAPPEEVFAFSHPDATLEGANAIRQYKRLTWVPETDARIHGFAGYFHCCLYKDTFMSIHPQLHTPKMFRFALILRPRNPWFAYFVFAIQNTSM